MNKEIKIPDGYEAKIEGNKVVLEPMESEDDKIRREILSFLKEGVPYYCPNSKRRQQWASWVEKQTEQKPLSTEETELNSIAFLEQLGYTCIPPGTKQKPSEWSEEDKEIWQDIFELCNLFGYDDACRLLKSLRPQPHWRPSKEQMRALALFRSSGRVINSLYNDLKKL